MIDRIGGLVITRVFTCLEDPNTSEALGFEGDIVAVPDIRMLDLQTGVAGGSLCHQKPVGFGGRIILRISITLVILHHNMTALVRILISDHVKIDDSFDRPPLAVSNFGAGLRSEQTLLLAAERRVADAPA